MDTANCTQATLVSEPAAENLIGRHFGPYQIVSALGEGGMATVYKAYQPAVEREVAVKVLPRHYARDPEFTARFDREAKILAQLQHPHILPVFDYGQTDGYAYIVMPFVKRGTLADVLTGQPQPFARIRQVVTQVGDALNYAHARGLIHRDIKPSNILIDEENNCLLTDFGLAKLVETNDNLTRAGSVLGTPSYMSPEQCSGKPLDGRSDIYALGVILFEMATGRVPYKAETPIALLAKHIYDPVPPAKDLNPALPEGLQLVILKALAKDPKDRFQKAVELVQAVQKALPDGPIMLLNKPVNRTLVTAANRKAVRSRMAAWPSWAWGAAGAGALAAAGLLFVFSDTRPAPDTSAAVTPAPEVNNRQTPSLPPAVATNPAAGNTLEKTSSGNVTPPPSRPEKKEQPDHTQLKPADAPANTPATDQTPDATLPAQLGAAPSSEPRVSDSPPQAPTSKPPVPLSTENEMALLPAGTVSGLDPDFGRYTHTLPEPLWVDLYEVSKKKWDSVYAWAITNGYHFSNPGKAKGPAHPVVEISWLDCAKWCNARSEREGLSPCFYLGGNVFKTSDTVPDCKFDASGYRLPTLNEWRYAARGSLADKRFPWGNTIQHSQANYMSGTNAYEVSPAKGGHPDFAKEAQPYTCPVDTFEPNGYGLYNMAGNVTERCWDISGSNRSLLGGSWSSDERALCIGFSSVTKPYHASDMDGFRTVRRTEQKENR